eukprot:g29036.t1
MSWIDRSTFPGLMWLPRRRSLDCGACWHRGRQPQGQCRFLRWGSCPSQVLAPDRRNVSVPPIAHFPNRRRPESFYVGDAADPDSDRSSASSCPGAPEPPLGSSSPRRCAEHVPTADTIGDSDWVSFDMVATLVAGPSVDRIGVGFLALPPVPLVVKRVRDAPGRFQREAAAVWTGLGSGMLQRSRIACSK